jgi:hypothetical protein
MAESDPQILDLEEEDDDEMMEMPSLDNFLVTEDGDNIADGIVKALNKLADRLDTQNKILIKIFSTMTKSA